MEPFHITQPLDVYLGISDFIHLYLLTCANESPNRIIVYVTNVYYDVTTLNGRFYHAVKWYTTHHHVSTGICIWIKRMKCLRWYVRRMQESITLEVKACEMISVLNRSILTFSKIWRQWSLRLWEVRTSCGNTFSWQFLESREISDSNTFPTLDFVQFNQVPF